MNIRQLAEIAGVSKTTVAYALQNNPRVSSATRTRIQNLARKHGYLANNKVREYMREVRGGRITPNRHSLTYISGLDRENRPRRETWPNERALVHGLMKEADLLQCDLDFVDWDLSGGLDRLGRILKARGCQGLFIGPASVPHLQIDLEWDQFSAVVSGYTVERPGLDLIAADLYSALIDAGKRVLDLGYDRAVFVIFDESNDRVGWRWLSAASMLRELFGENRILLLRGDPDSLLRKVRRLKWKEQRTAVVSHGILLKSLRKTGLHFPGDMGFVALDHLGMEAEVTAIQQPHEELGRRGLRQLLSAVEKGQTGIPDYPSRLLIPCGWHQGNTL